MNVQTYLYFAGDCRRAIELYKVAFGAEVLFLAPFAEAPESLQVPGKGHFIFHATLRIGETLLNMSDDPNGEKLVFGGFALLVHLASAEAVDTAAALLAKDGKIIVAPIETPWASRYAIVQDTFGITWKLQY